MSDDRNHFLPIFRKHLVSVVMKLEKRCSIENTVILKLFIKNKVPILVYKNKIVFDT